VDGLVTVLEPGVEVVHDVAVLSVTGVPVVVHVGEVVDVEVVVRNKGTVVETFAVRAYFDDSLIGSSVVVALAPGSDFRCHTGELHDLGVGLPRTKRNKH
jgi:hypothetical protein